MRWFFILVAGIGILVVAAPHAVGGTLLLTAPAAGTASRFARWVQSPVAVVRELSTLRSELAVLREERQRLLVDLAAAEGIRKENALLRELLNVITPRRPGHRVLAAVIGSDPLGLGGRLLVNAGAADGVGEGNAVITPGGILLGRTTEPSHWSAFVATLSNPTGSADVRILPDDVRGVVRSRNGFAHIEVLPQDRIFAGGERVVTSGADGLFPPGMFVGVVGALVSSETDVFQVRRLEQPGLAMPPTDVIILTP